jgi:putative ABC transport system ATP-binding protein
MEQQCAAGLDQLTSGRAFIGTAELGRLNEKQLTLLRREKVGFIFQQFNLLPRLSALANVALPMVYSGVSRGDREARAQTLLASVGIGDKPKSRPSQLSGGQQQRVAVARAVVAEPPLILADEPTGNLDTAHGEEVMRMLRALNEDGATIVMVTHSPAHADYAGRVVNMLDGRVLVETRRAA